MRRVTVTDGPLPQGIWQVANMEPDLVTAPQHLVVLRELMEREPLFHRPQFGTTRTDFEKMTATPFRLDKSIISTFERNLDLLPNAVHWYLHEFTAEALCFPPPWTSPAMRWL